jgi:hypothetical protein
MSGNQLDSHELNTYFLEVLRVVQPFGCVPFFGTLLGLGRDGGLIAGDDDIDFICELETLNAVTEKIRSSFKVVMVVDTLESQFGAGTRTFVIQFPSNLMHVDLYCPRIVNEQSLFPCHWYDSRHDERGWLRVPNSMIDAIRAHDYSKIGEPFLKLQPLCNYLYGPGWQQPSRKNIDHVHALINGVPIVRSTTKLEKYWGLSKLAYSNLYWKTKDFFLRFFL